jgi:hypothetical protein
VVVLPYIIIGIIPVTILYYFIQLYYRMSGPDLQRIDAVSRSPIQASLAEGTIFSLVAPDISLYATCALT